MLFLLSKSPFSASAQVLSGSLTGNVTDPSGAAVPGAKVTALSVNTGIAREAATDDRGGYVLSDMQAGTYKLTFSAPSFSGVVESGVGVVPKTVRRVDIQLQLASAEQSVSIAADSASLQTDRADVNTQVTTQEIANLPLTGTNGTRNFESIFQTIPGFSPPAASHSIASNPTEAQAFNVNGSTYTGNNIKLDGASHTFRWLPEIAAYIPPSEAIETVSVVTNSFDRASLPAPIST